MSSELERLDDLSPDESVGAFGGSGQWIEIGTVKDIREKFAHIEALEAENARKDTALATILGLIGNVDHKGGGANAARMYADMLNDIRVVARRAREGGNADG